MTTYEYMQDDSEPWYMYKKITTARDVALLLSDYLAEKKTDVAWICYQDIADWIDLDISELTLIFRVINNRLRNRLGIDRKVYVYAIDSRKPPTKEYRYTRHYHEYLIGTRREARIRDMPCLPSDFQKESADQQVL